MAKIKLSDAPGCIGSPIIRKEGHPICKNCPFKNVCAKLAQMNAKRLMESLGITAISTNTGKKLTPGAEKMTIAQLESPKFKGKKPLTSRGRQMQSSMFKKVSVPEIVEIMDQTSRRLVAHGLQEVQPDWARELLLLLWDNGGALKKKDMRDYLRHELGHAQMSAASNVSNFINATTNADLIKEDKETLRLIT